MFSVPHSEEDALRRLATGQPSTHRSSTVMTNRIGIEAEVVARLTDGIEPEEVRRVLVRCLAGELSPPVALMQMVCDTENVSIVRAAVDEVTERAANDSRAGDSLVRDRVDDLTELFVENEAGCARIVDVLRSSLDSEVPARAREEGIALVERLFDRGARPVGEGSGVSVSPGRPEVLDEAARTIVEQLDRWGLLAADRAILQIGCGIGRFETMLAPRVREAHGIDSSAEMIKVAERRCEALPNVFLSRTSGRDLSQFGDATLDLVFTVNLFADLVQSEAALVARYFAEARRVLVPGGSFVIFNFSHRGDPAADSADVRRLAAGAGFEVVADAVRPPGGWDGVGWWLRRTP